jgi:hypothetical protein
MNKTRNNNKKNKGRNNSNKKRITLKRGGYEEVKIRGIVFPNIIEPQRKDLENIYLSLSKKHHGLGIRDSLNDVDTMFALIKLDFDGKKIPEDQVYEFEKTIKHNPRAMKGGCFIGDWFKNLFNDPEDTIESIRDEYGTPDVIRIGGKCEKTKKTKN